MEVKHYDLFAGIGGFSYALDTVFDNYEIKHIFCEWEAFPTAVLKKHWPDATYYGDIADLVADTDRQRDSHGLGEIQEANGEVPQRNNDAEFSNSNSKHAPHTNPKRTRLERSEQEQPTRHSGQRGGEWSDKAQNLTILTGGFPCQPFSHAGRRKGTKDDRYKWPDMFRVIRNVRPTWVIAENVRGLVTWNDGMVLETVCADLESEGYEVQPFVIPACAIGAPHRRDRVWIVAYDRRERWGQRPDQDLRPESQEPERSHHGSSSLGWNRDWREVALTTCHDGVDDGLPRQMGGVTISASRHRKEQLKAYGNAIVPQVAMQIFQAIKSTI